jgi:hypothetical protein
MKLYHFTAKCFLKGIEKDGLTRGCMLKSMSPPSFIPNSQWLTSNPEFEQSWLNPNSTLPYKRNEVRLTIEIPDHAEANAKPWSQMKFLVPEVAQDLSQFGDPENWWIYSGNIPPQWIATIDSYCESRGEK